MVNHQALDVAVRRLFPGLVSTATDMKILAKARDFGRWLQHIATRYRDAIIAEYHRVLREQSRCA